MSSRYILATVLAMASCGSAAAEEQWYAGIGAAFSRPAIDVDRTTASIGAQWEGVPTTVDDKGDGLKLYLGWQPIRYFSLEVGYTDFGRASTYSTLLSPTSRDTASVQWDGYGVDVSALGSWWIGDRFSLYARGGASAWDVECKIVEDGTAGYRPRSSSETGISPLAGAGVAVRFVPQGTLRFEFQRYFDVGGDEVGGKVDVDVVSVGAHYHF